MHEGSFCTVFDCMDGRCQDLTNQWVHEHLNVLYPDTITEAGMDRVLAQGNAVEVAQIKARAAISTEKHGSRVAVIVGHSQCAGNPVDDDEHRRNIQKACEQVKAWGMFDEVIGLFEGGDADAQKWQVEEVCRV